MPGLLQDDLNFKIDTADMTGALGALGAAIKGLNMLNENHSKFSLSKYSLDSFLRLDIAALAALNVFPQNQDMNGGAAGSLFGLLNQCKT